MGNQQLKLIEYCQNHPLHSACILLFLVGLIVCFVMAFVPTIPQTKIDLTEQNPDFSNLNQNGIISFAVGVVASVLFIICMMIMKLKINS